MKRILSSSTVLAGIFFAGALTNLHAERGCSNATLNGAYGFYSAGNVLTAGTPPRVVLGREVYDGQGNFVDTLLAINNDGMLTRTTSSGTYTVTADCRGTVFAVLFTPSGTLNLSVPFVIVDGGNEIDFILSSTPPVLIGYGVRKKQFPDNNRVCSNATLNGTYGFSSTGTVVSTGTPRVLLGRETYDGNGHFSDILTVNSGGALLETTNSGTYTVKPDCTGTIFTTLGQLNLVVDFVIVDSGKEIYFIISSNPVSLIAYGVRTKFSANQE
jgi:hypothetical protein